MISKITDVIAETRAHGLSYIAVPSENGHFELKGQRVSLLHGYNYPSDPQEYEIRWEVTQHIEEQDHAAISVLGLEPYGDWKLPRRRRCQMCGDFATDCYHGVTHCDRESCGDELRAHLRHQDKKRDFARILCKCGGSMNANDVGLIDAMSGSISSLKRSLDRGGISFEMVDYVRPLFCPRCPRDENNNQRELLEENGTRCHGCGYVHESIRTPEWTIKMVPRRVPDKFQKYLDNCCRECGLPDAPRQRLSDDVPAYPICDECYVPPR